jgi:5'(3')-deoxyribonucleotidase
MERLIVYIDMDHTFCDFDGHKKIWQKFATTPIEESYPWSMRGYFESLLPMPGAIDFWNKYKETCDLYFLTRPSLLNRHSYTEKANWIHKYLGQEGLEKLILSPRKDLLYGDILIDDYYGNGQADFKGEWWQFGSEKFPDWSTCDQSLTKKINKRLESMRDEHILQLD